MLSDRIDPKALAALRLAIGATGILLVATDEGGNLHQVMDMEGNMPQLAYDLMESCNDQVRTMLERVEGPSLLLEDFHEIRRPGERA